MANSENEVFPGTANAEVCCTINGAVCTIPFSNQCGRDWCTRRVRYFKNLQKGKHLHCHLGDVLLKISPPKKTEIFISQEFSASKMSFTTSKKECRP